MTKKCVVTKYPRTADNDSLEVYGGVEVKFGHVAKTLGLSFGNEGKITAKQGSFNVYNPNGTSIATGITEFTIPGVELSYGIMPAVDNTVIVYTNKYKNLILSLNYLSWQPLPASIDGYEPPVININTLNYAKLNTMWNQNHYDLKGELNLATLQTFPKRVEFGCAYGENDYKVIMPSDFEVPAYVQFFGISNNKAGSSFLEIVAFDLSAFNKCTSLEIMGVPRESKVTGSINDLADALYANGKTSGTLNLQMGNTNVTYNGEVWDAAKGAEKGWSNIITFTPSGWTSSWDE